MAVTIEDNGARIQYLADAGQTDFIYPFLIIENSDLKVYLTPVGQPRNPVADLLMLNVDYTVVGAGLEDGGTITLIVPATLNDIVTIERDVPLTQTTLLTVGGPLTAATLNSVHDKLTLLIQQVEMKQEKRGLTYQPTDTLTDGQTTLPQLPANTGAGIPLWSTNGAGNLISAILQENPDCSTLRIELLSNTQLAPGAQDVGWYDADNTPNEINVDTALKRLNSQSRDIVQYNYLINGDMDIWQRGLSQVFVGATSGFTADRWLWQQLAGTATISRTPTSTADDSPFILRINRTVAGDASLSQKIENVRLFNGKSISLTFSSFTTSAPTISVTIVQNFGSGGSPLVQTVVDATLPLSGAQIHNFIVPIPSTAAKTIGPGDHIELLLGIDPLDTFSVLDFGKASWADTDFIHDFHRRFLSDEIALCQRYYQKSYNLDTPPATATGAGSTNRVITGVASSVFTIEDTVNFATTMRAQPLVIPYSDITGVINQVVVPSGDVIGSIFDENQYSFSVLANEGVASTARSIRYQWTAEAEIP